MTKLLTSLSLVVLFKFNSEQLVFFKDVFNIRWRIKRKERRVEEQKYQNKGTPLFLSSYYSIVRIHTDHPSPLHRNICRATGKKK